MPAKSSSPPEPDQVPAKTASDAPELSKPGASPVPSAFRYTGLLPTQYLHVPLTAYPAADERAATVFAWPDGAPDDRWEPTIDQPNQLPDNEPANTVQEG